MPLLPVTPLFPELAGAAPAAPGQLEAGAAAGAAGRAAAAAASPAAEAAAEAAALALARGQLCDISDITSAKRHIGKLLGITVPSSVSSAQLWLFALKLVRDGS